MLVVSKAVSPDVECWYLHKAYSTITVYNLHYAQYKGKLCTHIGVLLMTY